MNVLSKHNAKGAWLFSPAIWSLLLVLILSACNDQTTSKPTTQTPTNPGGTAFQCAAHSSNPVSLSFAYGSEKQAWIEDVVKDFNSQKQSACDGTITVTATPMGSGQSMQQIIDGSLKPDIWSPAGSVWLTLLNQKWQNKNGQNLIGTGATDTPSLVSSPVVIAMWKPQAEALGWPQKAIGWSDIAQLSQDPKGWAAYGHPEFGTFKFGHTHPDYSNSGLDAVIAMNYAAVNKTRTITTDDVNNQKTKDFVSSVESSVIHYGDSTGFFADKMFSNGPGYLSATVMYESLVIEANNKIKYPNLAYPVVAIYPKEGTFYSDHPFAVLNGSWMTPAKKAAALTFRNFLLAAPQQSKAQQYGFRPSNVTTKLATPFDSDHGVDPSQPQTLLQVPNADVIQTILTNWGQQRRRVDVELILDRSGSMNDPIGGTTKIEGAKQGLKEFVNLLSDDDQLGLTIFSNASDEITPISQLGPKRQDTLTRIDSIVAEGGTLLFDTIAKQTAALQTLPSKHIKAVVVLTDGDDNLSQLSVDQLIQKVAATGEDAGTSIKIFTIAYGDQANKADLTKIATATGGQEYDGNPQNIQSIYNQISVFF
ncbi:substrate-binding and vWA domain-containing protein [Tengunoibacter tsumagoiensis]|uniref:VWA domain-containing protein n=1 Tax=Tengunoibacter tsumagoiensis TaxID=2014871 RepID=A0A402A3D9_9CHLR|nr:substrate-binding and VWA domain-containing protein [Tengunoibacter tsumagoiensis]GCE13678.1 VWA domain-containing protein [Tengunoibacter tsumagoiensis]